MKKIFQEKLKWSNFFKFGGIGLLNTFIQQLSYVYLLRFSSLSLSQILSFGIALSFSYLANSRYNYHVPLSLKKFLRFSLANLPAWILQFVSLHIIVDLFQVPEKLALLSTLLVTIPLSFILITFSLKK